MSLFWTIAVVAVAGLAAFIAWERLVARRLRMLQKVQAQSDATVAADTAERAELAEIRRNPGNWIASQLNQSRKGRRVLNHAIADRTAEESAALSARDDVAASFRRGRAPGYSQEILIRILAIIWAIAYVAQYVLDLQVFLSVTGSLLPASLLTFVVTSLLGATPVGLAYIWSRRAGEDAVVPIVLRAATVLMITLFVSALLLMSTLAPKRAELAFAPRIEEQQSQLAVFRADSDNLGIAVQNSLIQRLKTERDQAANLYMIAVMLAGLLECGTGFFPPLALHIRRHHRAEATLASAKKVKSTAIQTLSLEKDATAEFISRRLEAAGVLQATFDQIMRQPGELGTGPEARPPVAPEAPAPTAETQTPPHPESPTPHRPFRPRLPPRIPTDEPGGTAPDPGFNQA